MIPTSDEQAHGAYRLGELGWAQFELACTEVMSLQGVPPESWHGRADRSRVALVPEGLDAPLERRRLPGPSLVAAVWANPGSRALWARANVVATVRSAVREHVDEERPSSLVVLTNLALARREVARVSAVAEHAADRALEVTVLGPAELSPLLDASPQVRRRVPSLLGVRDLAELVPDAVLQRSTADVDAARELAKVFVPTRAYAQTLAVLERNRFAVVTGPPEMGKTAIARVLGLAAMTEGWEVHECIRPDELWSRLSRERPQLFIADDAFGSTEYRPEAAERWALELDRILRAMDDRHWLVWTSRPAPLKAGLRRVHREHGVEHFPQPAEVHVDAAALDVEEKALILFRHARAARLPSRSIRLVQAHGWEIVSHRHFTPERIRRFVRTRLPELSSGAGSVASRELAEAVRAEIREPTTAMATSLRALAAEHRALLVALLDTPLGPVAERELAAAARRHADTGFPRPPGELVDRLTDHFVRLVPPLSVTWVHPSWRDLVIDELAADAPARRRFLSRSSIDGVLLALAVAGGAAGERNVPLVVDDADWDALADRLHELVSEVDDSGLYRLLAAVESALAAVPDERARSELDSLAATALERARQRWENAHELTSATLLGAWFALAAWVEEPPLIPDVAPTWIELVPTSRVDVASALELNRVDEWLRLAAVLEEYAPALLSSLGFPDRQSQVLAAFVDDAATLLEGERAAEAPPALTQCLRRLAAVAPEVARGARALAAALELRGEPDALRPADAPTKLPRAASAESSIVARILSDL